MSRDEEAMYSHQQLSDEAIAQRDASGMLMDNEGGYANDGAADYEGLEEDEDDEEAMLKEVVGEGHGKSSGMEDLGIGA